MALCLRMTLLIKNMIVILQGFQYLIYFVSMTGGCRRATSTAAAAAKALSRFFCFYPAYQNESQAGKYNSNYDVVNHYISLPLIMCNHY